MISEALLRHYFPIASSIVCVHWEPMWPAPIEEWRVDSLIIAFGRVDAALYSAHVHLRDHLFFEDVLTGETLEELLDLVVHDEFYVVLTDAWSLVSLYVAHLDLWIEEFRWVDPFRWACVVVDEFGGLVAQLEFDEMLDVYTLACPGLCAKYPGLRAVVDGLTICTKKILK